MAEHADRILFNALCHIFKHLIGIHLIFYKRISLSIGLQADTLTQLIHIVDVVHPLSVDNL